MNYPEINWGEAQAFGLDRFKQMDAEAISRYGLPIELMMENAGLHLARLVAAHSRKGENIRISVGNGNNGGGGLVAARRLAAWGFAVHLDFFTEITASLPRLQLDRAMRFGVQSEPAAHCDVWVDAWLGFSQRLPLPPPLEERIAEANESDCLRISLDLPTGYAADARQPHFRAAKVLCLAAPKRILWGYNRAAEIFIADIGMPGALYRSFGSEMPPFEKNTILKWMRAHE